MKKILLASVLSLISLASFGQLEIAKGDSSAATQTTRARLGANAAGRIGQKFSSGLFSPFALLSDLSASGVQKVNGISPTSGNVTIGTDNITEGTTNKYYTDARARGAFSASGPITLSGAGVIGFSGTAATVGLGNVTNALQVVNLGGVVSEQSGTLANRPAAATAGRFYMATDNGLTYYDNGTAWTPQTPAYTGDATSSVGGTVFTLANVTTAGTYGSGTQGAVQVPIVTVNAKGLVTTTTTVNLTPGLIGAPTLAMILPVTTVANNAAISGVTAPAANNVAVIEVNTDTAYSDTSTLYIMNSAGKYRKMILGPVENP